MLKLAKKDGASIGKFDDYKALYRHIMHEENLKLFEDHPEFAKCPWGFIILTPERVAELLQTLQKGYDKSILHEARNQKLSMLEVCKGDYKDITQIPLTPEIDVEGLRRDWCLAYCKSREISVTEIEDDEVA